MNLTPEKIYKKLNNNDLDKESSIELLISIIENSGNENLRLEAINILSKVKATGRRVFQVIENLLISDNNPDLRNSALKFLSINYKEKILTLIKWIINHETSFKCLINIIKILAEVENEESKNLLMEELKKIRFIKYLNAERNYKNRKYKKHLKKLIKSSIFEKLSHNQLSEIILNFIVIKHLSEMFPNVFFELNSQTTLIEELDLSDYLAYEVRGTPWGWKNNISNILELEGLNLLKNLKKLDLSNNLISDIQGLSENNSLTHLILKNNKIEQLSNLNTLKKLKNLKYLDLRGNKIIKKIKPNDLNPSIQLILKKYLDD